MQLVNELISAGYLKTPEIIDAFSEIYRKDFLRPEDKKDADLNEPLLIGYKQTISQPLTVAFMMELLSPKKNDKILDVGSGSGWTTALLARIVGGKGRVYGVEIIKELKKFAEKNISKYNFIKNGTTKIFQRDGYKGLPEYAPFDRIIVAAAANEVPEELLKQLKIGGRIVLPIGEQFASQDMVVIDKTGNKKYIKKIFPGFIFVPLIKS
ncbi:protein-L-isoaspartate O-methyltransferase [Candidatus Falkowbacteria bacterium]|nr:MAG: protein-L-isoaspartate O-methyltransferase [Candidatus Falkowbacteria bacterium]